MDIKLFVNALTLEEKKGLFNELKIRLEKGETLKEFYNRLLNNGTEMSVRMYNILTATIEKNDDYANCPISEILDNEGLSPCLMKIRGFGQTLLAEFKTLRGY